MSTALQNLVNQPYQHGFVTDIESDVAPKGLSEDTIRLISAKKNEPRVAARVPPRRPTATGSR